MRKIYLLPVALLIAPAVCLAQAPPASPTPVAPKVEQLDPNACARGGTPATIGQGGDIVVGSKPQDKTLSDKLASSGGVICPPAQVDPEIKAPTPPGGASMPVIPPPGGDPAVKPK